QALELSHRRIRVEAATALARLGESAGAAALVALAAEPVVRLRVLSSAEELGLGSQVDPQYASDEARAEAQVAVELSQPTFFGIPPAELKLVDSRTQFWPGYEAPVCCYLFHYTYRLAGGHYSNVAIAGPLVHAFAADLSDLSPDDIYAAYAGWHIEHESVYEVPCDRISTAYDPEIERFERRLREKGYQDVQRATLGYFFGDRVLVAHAAREGTAGIAVVDLQVIEWYPTRTRHNAIGPYEAFCIYKGRRLLRTFNSSP
ncbi:MAG: HEAT repeat domain-containing protein, partial [Pirellulaceae bacterium]